MKLKPEYIPDELKFRQQWCLWKVVVRDGNKTKMPFQDNGSPAKSNDPATWCDFGAALQEYKAGEWDGIGYIFATDDPYTGIDLDGCRNPETKEIVQWARDIIVQLSTYAEVSPSETGVKLWVKAKWPDDATHKVFPDVAAIGDKKPAIEVYDSVRFFAVTGNRLRGQIEIGERQEQIDELRKRFWKPAAAYQPSDFRSQSAAVDRARKYLAKMPVAVSGQDGHGVTFRAACVLVLGFALSPEEAYGLLCEWNANCQPPWSERELKHKVESAAQQNGERGYLRNVAAENYRHVPMPNYSLPAPKPQPEEREQQEDREPASDVIVTLLDTAARSYQAKVKAGKVQLFDLGLPDLDYAIGGGVEAGEMIIFAARPGHGKSMAAQQVIHNFTANGIPAMFISEEMSNLQIGKRAIQFATDVPREAWSDRASAVDNHIEQHFKERAPCYILEGCRTADRVATEIKRFVKDKGVGLAVIDYAQLLGAKGKGRYEEITNVSKAIRNVTSESGIPVIVLCQMSRAIEGRVPFIPQMSDIKETGQLEQDADVIVFQVWPHRIDKEQDPTEYHFYVGKNRSREINQWSVKCKFVPARQMLVYEKPKPIDDKPKLSDFPSDFGGVDADATLLDFGP